MNDAARARTLRGLLYLEHRAGVVRHAGGNSEKQARGAAADDAAAVKKEEKTEVKEECEEAAVTAASAASAAAFERPPPPGALLGVAEKLVRALDLPAAKRPRSTDSRAATQPAAAAAVANRRPAHPPARGQAAQAPVVVWTRRRATAETRWRAPSTPYLLARDVCETSGAKAFCALARGAVPRLVLAAAPAERVFYAVVPPAEPVHLYLDVDLAWGSSYARHLAAVVAASAGGDEAAVRRISEEVLLCHVLTALDRELAEGLPPAQGGAGEGGGGLESVLVLRGTTDAKASFHVHARAAGGAVFAEAAVVQRVVANAERRIAVSAARFCEVRNAARGAGGDEAPPLEAPSVAGVLDPSVYGRYSCFRLPLCTKRGRARPLAVYSLAADATLPALRAFAARERRCADEAAVVAYCLATVSPAEAAAAPRVVSEWTLAAAGGSSGGGGEAAAAAAAAPRGPTLLRLGAGGGAPSCRRAGTTSVVVPQRSVYPNPFDGAEAAVCLSDLAPVGEEDDDAAAAVLEEAEAWVVGRVWCRSRSVAEQERHYNPGRSVLLVRRGGGGGGCGGDDGDGDAPEYLAVPPAVVPHLVAAAAAGKPGGQRRRAAWRYAAVGEGASGAVDFCACVTFADAGAADAAAVDAFASARLAELHVAAQTLLGRSFRRVVVLQLQEEGGGKVAALRIHARMDGAAAFANGASMAAFGRRAFQSCCSGGGGDAACEGGLRVASTAFATEGELSLPAAPHRVLRLRRLRGAAATVGAARAAAWEPCSLEEACLLALPGRPAAAADVEVSVSDDARAVSARRVAAAAAASAVQPAAGDGGGDDARVKAALLVALKALCPAYGRLCPADFTHRRQGTERSGFAVTVTSGSRHCVLIGREHRTALPNLLFHGGGIYAKCWSNDCGGLPRLRLDWPPAAAEARAYLFPLQR